MREGLTLEVEGLVPFTEDRFQSFKIGFMDQAPPHGEIAPHWDDDHGVAVELAPVDQVILWGRNEALAALIPLPAGLESWQTYSLQVDPSGWVTFLVEGSVHCRAHLPAVLSTDSMHVFVGGVSVNADIRHGTVRLYRGVRYPTANPTPPPVG